MPTNSGLTAQQISRYHDEGCLIYPFQLFDASELESLTAIFEEHLAERGDRLSDELDTPHFRDDRLLDYLLHDRVLDLVESLIGPDIGLWSSHFISKEPYYGRRTPWHEDSAYWAGKFDRLDRIVTVWLAIDNSTEENGCMGVIPGTHHNGFSDYVDVADAGNSTFKREISGTTFSEEDVKWLVLKRGQCSFHDARIIHGAQPNTSPDRRAGYTMRYFSLRMKFNPMSAPGHKIWWARGKNFAGNTLLFR